MGSATQSGAISGAIAWGADRAAQLPSRVGASPRPGGGLVAITLRASSLNVGVRQNRGVTSAVRFEWQQRVESACSMTLEAAVREPIARSDR